MKMLQHKCEIMQVRPSVVCRGTTKAAKHWESYNEGGQEIERQNERDKAH